MSGGVYTRLVLQVKQGRVDPLVLCGEPVEVAICDFDDVARLSSEEALNALEFLRDMRNFEVVSRSVEAAEVLNEYRDALRKAAYVENGKAVVLRDDEVDALRNVVAAYDKEEAEHKEASGMSGGHILDSLMKLGRALSRAEAERK